VSDQDFFFDDEQPAEEAKSTSGKAAGSKRPAAPAAASDAPGAQDVSMTVAALIGVVALLAGVVIGILLPVGSTAPTPGAPITAPPAQTAPQLTPDQLEGQELPEGHPDIGGGGGGATATPNE
jgi:hypothetical protein